MPKKVQNNEQNIHLLFNDPNAFLEVHQTTIGYIVNRFIHTGFFEVSDRDEIIQYVNEKLLRDKIPKMQQQYDRSYFVTTYLSKIVHNVCLEYARANHRKRRQEVSLDVYQLETANTDNVADALVIEEEKKKLRTILRMYHKNQARIELFLKVLFGVGITDEQLISLYPTASSTDIHELTARCNATSDLDRKTDKELYEALTNFINKYEQKKNTPDALRKWLDTRIAEIIHLLNGTPKTANYDKETLRILFQFTFRNFHFRSP